MDTIDRIGRLQQRISELAAGKEIDTKHINVLLSEERQCEFDAEWKRQQKLRKAKKPAALNDYETRLYSQHCPLSPTSQLQPTQSAGDVRDI